MKTIKPSTIPVLLAVAAVLQSCGPKRPPGSADQGEKHLKLDPGQADSFKAVAEAEVIKKMIDQWKDLIDDANIAIDTQDGDLFWSVFTEESQDLFIEAAKIDMVLSGSENQTPIQHILEQQKDFNVVYSLEDEDHVNKTASLVAVIRSTGEQAKFPVKFVEKEGGGWIADYTSVLAVRLDNLKESLMRRLVADLDKALDAADETLFSATVTAATASGCPDFMHVVPPPPAAKPSAKASTKTAKPVTLADQLAAIQKAGIEIAVDSLDPVAMKAKLSGKSGEKTLGQIEVAFLEDAGKIRLDASTACVAPAPAPAQ